MRCRKIRFAKVISSIITFEKHVNNFGPLDNLVNVDESTITGFESDIITRVTDKLTLTAAFTYINSEVDKFVGFDVYNQNGMGGSGLRDLSGNDLPNTPKLTYSVTWIIVLS